MSHNDEFITLARQAAIEEVRYGVQMSTGEQITDEQALTLLTDENSPYRQCLMADMQHLPDEQITSIMRSFEV